MSGSDRVTLAEVQRFMAAHGLAETKFGRLAIGDPRLVQDMRGGRTPNARTSQHLRTFMRRYRSDGLRCMVDAEGKLWALKYMRTIKPVAFVTIRLKSAEQRLAQAQAAPGRVAVAQVQPVTLCDPILEEVEAFLARHDMPFTTFGLNALADATLVPTLRKGRKLRTVTAMTVRHYMAQYERPAPAPPPSPEQIVAEAQSALRVAAKATEVVAARAPSPAAPVPSPRGGEKGGRAINPKLFDMEGKAWCEQCELRQTKAKAAACESRFCKLKGGKP